MIIPVDLSIGQGSFGQRLPDIQVSSILAPFRWLSCS
jgi:hypothetical protein